MPCLSAMNFLVTPMLNGLLAAQCVLAQNCVVSQAHSLRVEGGYSNSSTQQPSKRDADKLMAESADLVKRKDEESLRNALRKAFIAYEIYKQHKAISRAVNALKAIKQIYVMLGEGEKFKEYSAQAAAYQQLEDCLPNCDSIIQQFNSNFYMPELSQLHFLEVAWWMSQIINDHNSEAVTLHNMGVLYVALGEKQKALASFVKALSLWREIRDRNREAKSLEAISWVYESLGEKQKAVKYYEQELSLWEAAKNPAREMATRTKIGGVYLAIGEPQQALKHYNQALVLARGMRTQKDEAAMLANIGRVYAALGEQQQAITYYTQALSLARAARHRDIEAAILNIIGRVYFSLGEQQQALEYHSQAFALAQKAKNQNIEAASLNNIGLVYLALDEKQKALESYTQALSLWRAVGERTDEARTLVNMGWTYAILGEVQKALGYYNQALPLMQAAGDRRGEVMALDHLAILFRRDSPYLAIWYGKQAVNLLQSLRTDIQGLDRSLQQSFLKSVADTYARLIGLLIEQGRLPEAERVNEMLKDEEYFQFTRRDQKVASALKLRSDLTPTERKAVEEYSRIAEQLTTIGKELEQLETARRKLPEDAPFPQQARLDELNKQLASASTALSLFQQQLAAEFKTKGNERPPEDISAWKAGLQRWGGTGTVMIYTVTQEDKLYVIVTTNKVQEAHQVEIKAAT